MKSLEVTVTMEITNIGTQGYPGVGKTSVLDLAMGKDPAPTRASTDCIDPPSHYLMTDSATEGVEWERVTTDKMFELMCKAMKKTIEENPQVVSAESDEPTAAILSSNDMQLLSQPSKSSSRDKPDPSHDRDDSPYSVFPDLVNKLSTSKSSGVIFKSHWMMVTDCGGQPPFLDAAALFLRNSCLQILPVKLTQRLNKKPKFSYYYEGVRAAFDDHYVPLTYKQTIETLAKSVASIQAPYTPSATKCPEGAKFTIVGTFEDKVNQETIEDKESILKKVLEPYEPFQVRLDKKVILPVNAVVSDAEERAKSAEKLRRLIQKSDVSMKVDIKLRWFGLLLSILTIAEKEQRTVLTLDQCNKLGDTLGMDKLETKQAIQFFHDISLIMYFDTPKLRDSVIIDTKPVLNKLSRLLSVAFLEEQFLNDHLKILFPSRAKELLQCHGLIEITMLEKSGINFAEPITLRFFLDILEHVKIVVAINEESEYFMPCALSYCRKPSVSESSPWVIRLQVRRGVSKEYIPIPVGYLPAMIVFLLTKFLSHFSIATDRQRRQYRNKIRLEYEPGGHVFFVQRRLQLEIYYSGFKKLPQECKTIRNRVLKSIKLTEEKLHIIQEGEGAITKVDSFLCSCGKGSAHHTCAFKPLSGILECEETYSLFDLQTRHLHWLGGLHVLLTCSVQ